MNQSNIRNFCIIAHIDHGKSTLADRLLEVTGTVAHREMTEQLLDSNPIERERGITIKLAPVRMIYKIQNSNIKIQNENKKILNFDFYILNLIDTPGHVDFSYEVSRSLQACEGALLVVDATQGVQAQTIANLNLARKQNLSIVPLINKIDLPNAQVERCMDELSNLGFGREEIIPISAKVGTHIDKVLNAVVNRIPAPQGTQNAPLRALVFSSQYDPHKGVVVYVRVVDGSIGAARLASSGQNKLEFMASGVEFEPIEIGYFTPQLRSGDELQTGEVGYIATGLKDVALGKVGDTITAFSHQPSVIRQSESRKLTTESIVPLPGYQEPKPMVFLGLYPINSDEYPQVREALAKLRLSDSAFSYRPISSLALGNGFHCGFLGLLHAEVVQERLSREFGLSLLATAPTVEYKIKLAVSRLTSAVRRPESGKRKADSLISIQSAAEFPDLSLIVKALEPVMEVSIFAPKRYVGSIMQLAQDKRAEYIDLSYMGEQGKFTYLMPLAEMIIDFFDRLKSVSEGYASLDYEFFDYQEAEIVKLDILLNHEKVDAFSQLVVSERAQYLGRQMVEKLKDVIPRHQFAVPIQATIGGNIIARADVKAFRKDVTQKLYGGDRTRKDKLLEAQKKGKQRMKRVGKVEIPQNAFLAIFKRY